MIPRQRHRGAKRICEIYCNSRLASQARYYDNLFTFDEDGLLSMEDLKRQTAKSPDIMLKDLRRLFEKDMFKNCTLEQSPRPGVRLLGANEGVRYVTVTCAHCGGKTTLREGTQGVCEYFGSRIEA